MMGGLLNIGNRPFASLLNRSMAGFGSPGFIGVDIIFNKDMYMSELVS